MDIAQVQGRPIAHPINKRLNRLTRLVIITFNLASFITNLNARPQAESLIGSKRSQQGSSEDHSSRLQSNQQSSEDISSSQEGSQTASFEQRSSSNLENSALVYLQKYGYMSAPPNAEANNLISEESFSEAITSFQRFAGLPETGHIDNQTLRLMKLPRCGNIDRPQQVGLDIKTSSGNNQSSIRGLLRSLRRRKRYALQGSKWRRQELTYRISQYPTRFAAKRHEVDSQIEKAFSIWSQVAPINFVVKRDGRVHIDIRFASGDHGDGDAFDGPGNTLAHAYFPQYGGDAHFDDQEYWTIDSYTGTNIFQVAAHELGHSLGLGHSNVREALMAPFYQKYKPNFKLHIDDVLAIQALYGEKAFLPELSQTSPVAPPSSLPTTTTTTTTTTSTTTQAPTTAITPRSHLSTVGPFYGRHKPGIFNTNKPTDSHETSDDENTIPDLSSFNGNGIGFEGDNSPPSYPSDLCDDPKIDAITRTEDGNTYVFKDQFYWLLTTQGLAKGYPRRITSDWDGLPGSLDAALTWADGKTFFFKGNKYWRFRNRRRDVGYPKLISAGFAGIPDDIDAALVWSGNGRTYIFKGTEYWRFDSKADPPVSSEYPRSIKVWTGVPSHLNAAFKWENNVTYFFKGNQYYRFNDKEFKVETRGKPAFPRQSAEWWFGCGASNMAQKAMPNSSESTQDWSFYAGFEENTKLMGTHINDHKPGTFEQTTSEFGRRIDEEEASFTATNRVQHQGSRIGLHNPMRPKSSAMAKTNQNFLILQSTLLLISIIRVNSLLGAQIQRRACVFF